MISIISFAGFYFRFRKKEISVIPPKTNIISKLSVLLALNKSPNPLDTYITVISLYSWKEDNLSLMAA